LFVGFIYPYGSTGNTNAGAAVYDCSTGALYANGVNFNFKSGVQPGHRSFQYYASYGAEQIMGRPTINLVDGTEPSLREYFVDDALLNTNNVRPGNPITTANASTYIADLAVNTLQIAGNAVTVPVGVYTADLPAAFTTPGEYLVQSLTMPCTGSPVTVFAGF
jgi:hypothetical protein